MDVKARIFLGNYIFDSLSIFFFFRLRFLAGSDFGFGW
jgi:hypothetical protein